MGFTRAASMALILLAASALVAGCVVSPVPEPPAVNAELLTVELISTSPDNPDAEPDTAIIRGEPGAVYQRVGSAVEDGQALIRVVNLDLAEEPREVAVEPDGSFDLSLAGRPGNLFRLRAYGDELWSSTPVDVVVPPESGPLQPLPEPPSGSCLSVRAPSVLDFGAVAIGDIAVEVISIENDCDDQTYIEVMTLRIGDTELPDCELEYQTCIGDTDDPVDMAPHCDEDYSFCTESCSTEYEDCIATGGTEEECSQLDQLCGENCETEQTLCLEEFCGDWLGTCQETPYEEPQGFSAHTGATPVIIPPGASRSVVVTFAPLWTGPAEDSLLSWFDVEAEERMAISLVGEGIP